MFLENDYAEPLFSMHGGPPKAFRCKQCKKVTATEGGMRSHLQFIHHWEEQPCLSSTEFQTEQKKNPERKLRVSQPSRNRAKQDAASTEKNGTQKLTETNVGKLPKPTNEENLFSQTLAESSNSATVPTDNPIASGAESTTGEDQKTVTK